MGIDKSVKTYIFSLFLLLNFYIYTKFLYKGSSILDNFNDIHPFEQKGLLNKICKNSMKGLKKIVSV